MLQKNRDSVTYRFKEEILERYVVEISCFATSLFSYIFGEQ